MKRLLIDLTIYCITRGLGCANEHGKIGIKAHKEKVESKSATIPEVRVPGPCAQMNVLSKSLRTAFVKALCASLDTPGGAAMI
ncbi:hypothetical protein GFER_07890 [Geoalkalibacter ferrihydriticus DSM 17813]|uniref:Uncharacterized protein n=1 Tax=Geoalkalibacter ferrihydriticus DSM 17813 TaxID=1121915 RepID=A0A0C2HQ05_9BACT|nr:hypothetical protein GFER_07890 [Geoalkalibacter ferrihydriticus DSM 17813]